MSQHVSGLPFSPPTGPSQQPPQNLTPSEATSVISSRKRAGLYYSITTLPSPYAPWSPLPDPQNASKETRPCHCSSSRIHTLACGHTVAVPGLAETCAQNCLGMQTSFHRDDVKETLAKITAAAQLGLNGYVATFLAADGSQTAFDKAQILLMVKEKMAFTHQRPRPDLCSGDFECRKCGCGGHRASFPAFVVKEKSLVVVEREEQDVAVVLAVQERMQGWKGEGKGKKGKGKEKGMLDRVREARIGKARREEKRRVGERLRMENLPDEMEELLREF